MTDLGWEEDCLVWYHTFRHMSRDVVTWCRVLTCDVVMSRRHVISCYVMSRRHVMSCHVVMSCHAMSSCSIHPKAQRCAFGFSLNSPVLGTDIRNKKLLMTGNFELLMIINQYFISFEAVGSAICISVWIWLRSALIQRNDPTLDQHYMQLD